jgi:hypothetical protein
MREPFWKLETREEMRVVNGVLRRRFPEAFSLLVESLESADPLGVVYPGNPGEYDDVVREVVVLLAHVNADLSVTPPGEIERALFEGLQRCFGEMPDADKVQLAVETIVNSLAGR